MKKYLYLLLVVCGLMTACSHEPDAKGKIYGIVTTADTAEPMRATGVELYKNDSYKEGNYTFTTDTYSLLLKTTTFDDGHFEFEKLNAGDYRVVVAAQGYNRQQYDVKVEEGRTAKIDLQLYKLDTYLTVTTKAVQLKSGSVVQFSGVNSCSNTGYWSDENGFIYGREQNLSLTNGKRITAKEGFIAEVSGLSKGTWYVMAYSKNKVGYEFGSVISFEISGTPEVETKDATNITATTATLNGKIVYEGDPQYTKRGFVYSYSFPKPTIDDPETATTNVIVSGNSKDFSVNITDLVKAKKYYVRAYVISSDCIEYGETVEFIAETYKMYVVIDNLAIQRTDLGNAWRDDAIKMCKNSAIEGFSDWRLPSRSELSIMYQKRFEIGGFSHGNYWSSDIYEGTYYTTYYYVNFDTGKTDGDRYTSYNYYVRCVRTMN